MLLSYLLFSATRCNSVAGACLVGAGSLLASEFGEEALSVRAGTPSLGGAEDLALDSAAASSSARIS